MMLDGCPSLAFLMLFHFLVYDLLQTYFVVFF